MIMLCSCDNLCLTVVLNAYLQPGFDGYVKFLQVQQGDNIPISLILIFIF